MQDHLYLSPPLPRNPTNTYYSALPFPWPKFNSDSGHCTTSYGKAWRSSRPQDLSPCICYGSSFPRPPPPSATQTHAGPTGPLSICRGSSFPPPPPRSTAQPHAGPTYAQLCTPEARMAHTGSCPLSYTSGLSWQPSPSPHTRAWAPFMPL